MWPLDTPMNMRSFKSLAPYSTKAISKWLFQREFFPNPHEVVHYPQGLWSNLEPQPFLVSHFYFLHIQVHVSLLPSWNWVSSSGCLAWWLRTQVTEWPGDVSAFWCSLIWGQGLGCLYDPTMPSVPLGERNGYILRRGWEVQTQTLCAILLICKVIQTTCLCDLSGPL